MLVVNLYGAPGSGKSTGAAYVFSKLKMLGVNAELVTEVAKDKVWEGNEIALFDQAYIFGEQHYRISRVTDKVDVVVTDSPILLSSFYARDPVLGEEFDTLVTKIAHSYNTYDAFIERVKPYNERGRLQSKEESDVYSFAMGEFLTNRGVACRYYSGDEQGYDVLVHDILKTLKNQKKEVEINV